jgi:hypothetical protein
MLEPAERVEHRFQFAEAKSVIKLSREPLQINIGGIHGNVPVLAKPAAEVASGRSEGQHTRTGIKVVERLLLDRIDAKTGSPPVAGQHHAFIVSLSNETKAALIRTQFAFARAEVSLDATVSKPVPPLSAHDAGFNFLTGKSWHSLSAFRTQEFRSQELQEFRRKASNRSGTPSPLAPTLIPPPELLQLL